MKLYSKRYSINKEKKIYLGFISIIIISLLVGFFFYLVVSDNDKNMVISMQRDFFNGVGLGKINYLGSFINSLLINFLYVFLIFLFGMSVVGIVFILFLLIIKSFLIGFSISSIIGSFGFKGLILSIIYVFPHQLLFLIVLLLMSYYGCKFCFKLFKYLFLKEVVNFRFFKDKYLKVFFISICVSSLCSLYEVFMVPFLIKLFV